MRFLVIIEDESDIPNLLAARFAAEGFRVATAGDGRSGIRAIQQCPPHLIILDLLLPEMSGWNVVRALKGNLTTHDIPILIADDDMVWTNSVTRLLEAEGYRVLRARTGVDALYEARMRRPDLILLNPELPHVSGWAVCRMLRQSPEFSNVKEALLTLEGEAAYRSGADRYLVKGAQAEPTLPPVRAFHHPASGILAAFLQRRAVAA